MTTERERAQYNLAGEFIQAKREGPEVQLTLDEYVDLVTDFGSFALVLDLIDTSE